MDHLIELLEVVYADRVYIYALVSSELAKKQGAPAVFTIMKGGVIAISDTYPEKWRNLGLIHEIMDSNGRLHAHSCVESLKTELEMAEYFRFDMEAYTAFRLKFFTDLIAFYKKSPDFEGRSGLIHRLEHSKRHLENLEVLQLQPA